MAKLETIMVPSTAEGKHWSVGCYKNDKGGIRASAIEGDLTKEDAGNGRYYTSFKYALYGDTRMYAERAEGTMTAKNITKVVTNWLRKMRDVGLITHEAHDEAVAKIPSHVRIGKR